MFLIREAGPKDFKGVFALAKVLDSYNLPADAGYIRQLLKASESSFGGLLPKSKARYLFVIEDERRIAGCSMIIAKHGTRGHPHIWLALDRLNKHSDTLGITKSHRVLQMGATENGPTEVGGLVVLPRYRRRPERCGLQISFARFLYMAAHPERFEATVLIEYRGAMGAGGKSPFWEAIGKVFTGLEYHKADRLSVENKEFILGLLPQEPIYCALLPKNVQQAIGAIHPSAQPAARLAAKLGFKRIGQVEPFDGGPYYTAPREKVKVVRETRALSLFRGGVKERSRLYLVGTEAGGYFRAVITPGTITGGRFTMEEEAFRKLKVKAGDPAYACPVPR